MKQEVLDSFNKTKTHFKQLDGLRCIAVLSVLICHWMRYRVIGLIPLGSMGVNLFFVLSGFLITRILLISKDENNGTSIFPPIKRFYIRRTLRIFPIYYLTLIFLVLINFPATRENIIWLSTYTFNIKMSFLNIYKDNPFGYLNHLWSLSVEEQFYIFLPLMIFLIPKAKIKPFLYFVILLGVLSRFLLYMISAPSFSLYALPCCCFDAFGIGSLLAYFILYELEILESILKKNYIFIIIVSIFVIDIVYSNLYIKGYYEGCTVLERLIFSACCFWIVGKAALAEYTGLIRKFLENRITIYIGKISYGLYLYHYFAFPLFTTYLNPILINHLHINSKYLLDPAIEHNNGLLLALFLFIFTFLVASISWYFIELPISKLKERITSRPA